MTVSEALERSIEEAIRQKKLDAALNAAPIEAARKVARLMDDPEFPYINGKYDNVSAALFLKYCVALGLSEVAEAAKPKSESKLSELRVIAKKASTCC